MLFTNWLIKPSTLFSLSPIIPVMVIHDLHTAIPLAQALLAGGINIFEITLRTPVALDAIRLLKQALPDAIVGAGTVTTVVQLQQCIAAGAQFAISPGLTHDLLHAGKEASIALIPGIATISELMQGIDAGYSYFKFFPAEVSGGVNMLKAIAGPFPTVRFCPTGGINQKNVLDYLALPNVHCVGGSWIVPEEAIKQGQWSQITTLCADAIAEIGTINYLN